MKNIGEISLNTDGYETQIVVFIDILGFGNFVGYTDEKNSLEDVLKLFSFSSEWRSSGYISVSDDKFAGYRPAFNFFSDTIMMAFPLDVFKYDSPNFEILGKQALIATINDFLINIQVGMLKYGLLSRGCIHLGKIYHSDSLWFGPAINQAHIYESKKAIFPRIILTDSVVNYFGYDLLINLNYRKDEDFFYFNYLDWLHDLSDMNDYHDAVLILEDIINKNIEKVTDEKSKKKWEWLKVKLMQQ